MNKAEQFWAQTLDALSGKSDGPEGAIVEGLRLIKVAAQNGCTSRAWCRGKVCTVAVFVSNVTWFGRGASPVEALERLGYYEAH